MREIIPRLIQALGQKDGNPVVGASELLLSFVAAYEHIPAHRRQHLFTLLVQTLGPAEFLFALLCMLADKYSIDENTQEFAAELMSQFSPEVQLEVREQY